MIFTIIRILQSRQ
uniref:Uncharacterized protein n=1 Tax=Arundo donax TaxID=35708 RepID=A0A0A9AV12_ARUDO